MSLWQRLKNLWALSGALVQREKNIFEKIEDDFYPPKIDSPQAVVVPYKKRDPVKEIIGEETETV